MACSSPAYLTTAQAAVRLGLSVPTVLAHIRTGRLDAENWGTGELRPTYRITEAALAEFGKARKPVPPPQPAKRRRRPVAAVTRYSDGF